MREVCERPDLQAVGRKLTVRGEDGARGRDPYPDKKAAGWTLLFCPSSIALFLSVVLSSDDSGSTAAFFDLRGREDLV